MQIYTFGQDIKKEKSHSKNDPIYKDEGYLNLINKIRPRR